MIGLSANNVDSHAGWVKDIDNLVPGGASLDFPIIGDESREVANLYGMLDKQDLTNVDKKGMAMTIRLVFISEQCSIISSIFSSPSVFNHPRQR